ncbi:MAG TPA: FAD-dependent oxidoreductase [bacterium]|nr:FAD-dependent oxidoreductase [bacterium]
MDKACARGLPDGSVETDVAIIGGGLLGCALAFKLAKAGVDTMLLERGELNREASGTNAGSLHIQLLRPPGMDEAWLERFRPLVRLHIDAAKAWRGLESEAGIQVGVRMHGGLFLAETEDELRILQKKVAVERAEGLDTTLISGDEARAMCPLLAQSVIAADYCPDDGLANALLVTPALARRAMDYGACVATHHEVLAITIRGVNDFLLDTTKRQVRAQRVVVAAGPWTGRVAKMVGMDLPIGPNVLSMNVTEAQRPELDLLIQHIGRRLTLKQTESGTYIVGGGWPGEYAATGNWKGTTVESLAGNMGAAVAVLPRIARLRVLRTWAGLGANTPDWRPIIGEYAPAPGFYVLFAGLGFTLGLTCAQRMADLLRQPTGAHSAAGTAFAPGRYIESPAGSA